MSKHRTKKQKLHPHRSFLIFWSNEPKKPLFKASVNRQIKNDPQTANTEIQHVKNANKLAQEGYIKPIKREILTSLILASFILGLEVVIYLAWYVQ